MKNRILLVFVFFLTTVFSFAQNDYAVKKDIILMKERTMVAVEYLNNNGLKFTDKQKTACIKAFMEYADVIMKLKEKTALQYESDKKSSNSKLNEKEAVMEQRKYTPSNAMRFQKKRDDAVKKTLKGRQVSKYEVLISDIHPVTMEVTKKSEKVNKSKK